MSLSNYTRFCDAIVLLMRPLVEIVIHDLSSETIAYINGTLTKRKAGDASLLEVASLDDTIDKIVYPKLNFDGRLIKSISVPLEGQYLMCINCDVSVFDQMRMLSQQMIHVDEGEKPESLFKNDWQERLHLAIHGFLAEKAWVFDHLTLSQKKDLIKHLYQIDAFREKNAADYVALTLNMGRATIFKYLKEWRKNDNKRIPIRKKSESF